MTFSFTRLIGTEILGYGTTPERVSDFNRVRNDMLGKAQTENNYLKVQLFKNKSATLDFLVKLFIDKPEKLLNLFEETQ